MHSLLQIVAIISALVGTYLLAFGLKVEKQYSEDLIEELKLKEKGFLILSDVTQRKRLFGWGLALLTLAAALQVSILIWY